MGNGCFKNEPRLKRSTGRAIALCVALAWVVQPQARAALETTANSGSANASASFFGTSFPGATDSAMYGPLGGVAVAEVAGGQVRAVQPGSGLNAATAAGRFGDIPSFALRADTAIDMTVGNSGSGNEPLAFNYTINGGELRLFSPGGQFNGLVSTVAASIFVFAPGFCGFSGSGASLCAARSLRLLPRFSAPPRESISSIRGVSECPP